MRKVPPEELKKILADHKLWLETDGKKGKRANLERTELQEADLQGVNLERAELQEADLQGTVLLNAKLQGADLREADLRSAFLQRANFQKADLSAVNLQEANLFKANLQKANLFKADLQKTDLRLANLQEASLSDANLRRADLWRANLQEADLGGANLQEADLRGANLQGADLGRANFQDASLDNATLRDADLQGADLTKVKGLLASQLASANVSGAKLPKDIAKFEGLAHVEETSRNARKILLAMLLGCAYSWLTIATTTDARLLTNSASSPLPIIQTEIPIAGFYWAAPIILLSLYFYFHLYLQRLWRDLAALPAVFPDGKALDERAYPWLLNGLVRAHFKRLQRGRPPLSRLENWISILLAWWVVPFTLFLFWGRYLPRHEWTGTALHIALLVVLVGAAIGLHQLAARTLRGDKGKPIQWRRPWLEERLRQAAVILGIGILLTVFSYGSINGTRTEDPVFTDVRTWVPWTFALAGYSTFADLREADVSTKPEQWWTASPEKELEIIKAARLQGSDLRHADAVRAFLVRADLRDANLQGAILSFANLQGADLRDAILQGADLRGADLQEADLRGADLQGAILKDANLQKVLLEGANLQGASLVLADLQGAFLEGAILQGADLRYASLQGVYLRDANLQGADLWRASLQEADLGGANLQEADLRGANLQGVYLRDANLQGADLTDTFGLTQERLDQACGNEETKLPSGLVVKPCPQ